MRIGINLLPFKEVTGLEVYAQTLLENLGKIDKEDEFFLFINQIDLPELHFDFPNFHYIKLPVNPLRKFIWPLFEQIISPFYLNQYKLDVLFCPTVFNPLISPCKKVTTIHDCGYLYDKRFTFKNLYLRFATWAATKSSKIITISNFSKKEILNFYKIPNQKIKVIYRSVPREICSNKTEVRAILKKFNIKNPYFFYLGLIVPHKNIVNLLKAFKMVNEKYAGIKLVLAGKIKPDLLDITQLIKKLNLEKRIQLTGLITEKEKNVLYKNSLALVFPSFHEGFGLPVLEAQSLGIPVLTSNITALPEVAGKAALYVNPRDIKQIFKGMEKLLEDRDFCRQLIKEGFQNIKRFSPEKEAKETLKVLKEIGSK